MLPCTPFANMRMLTRRPCLTSTRHTHAAHSTRLETGVTNGCTHETHTTTSLMHTYTCQQPAVTRRDLLTLCTRPCIILLAPAAWLAADVNTQKRTATSNSLLPEVQLHMPAQASSCLHTAPCGVRTHSARCARLALAKGYVHVHDDALRLGPHALLALHTHGRPQLLYERGQLDGRDEAGGLRVQP